ncbi:MAG: sodium:proton antiporter [Candidatus Brocadiae bacterium]|nr:sodium:proton antiporter [Candidatus Brocadiia bacterium]
MIWDQYLPLIMFLISFVVGLLIFCISDSQHRLRIFLNLIGAISKLFLIAYMFWGVYQEHHYEYRLPVFPGIDFVLAADSLSLLFMGLSILLWLLTTIYAIGYLEHSPHQSRFFAFFSLCVSSTMGIAMAGNLFTLFLFYELLTISTYPLVVHRGTEKALEGGMTYIKYALTAGIPCLIGIVWLHTLTGDRSFHETGYLSSLGEEHYTALRIIFCLLVAGFGVKAAIVPLHGWLAKAMVAPAPVSALLHAVAVVKAGAFALIRLVYDVYGVSFLQNLGLDFPLLCLASLTIIYGSICALRQNDLKKCLAFSTVSQVSYIILGISLFGTLSTIGGVVHLVHQGLMKITMFFGAGNLAETLGIHKIDEMDGVGRRMPGTMIAFSVAALGMIGLPPMAGFVTKWYLGLGVLESGSYWVIAVLLSSSFLNCAYFLPILYRAWFKKAQGDFEEKKEASVWETSPALLFPPIATATLAFSVGFMVYSSVGPLAWIKMLANREYGYFMVYPIPYNLTLSNNIGNFILFVFVLSTLLLLLRKFLDKVLFFALPFVCSFFLYLGIFQNDFFLDFPQYLFGLKIAINPSNRIFVILISILWTASAFYSYSYMSHTPNRLRYSFCFLLSFLGNLGIVLVEDIPGFYFCYVLMTFAAYGLIVHDGTKPSQKAGIVYLVLSILGESMILVGFLWVVSYTQVMEIAQISSIIHTLPGHEILLGLFVVGFGIKMGFVPLHVWLPLAHPCAPTPASAVLSGSIIKAGMFGFLRFLPLGIAELPVLGTVFVFWGLGTCFYAALVGCTQEKPKTILAYSSISQMGLAAMALGMILLKPELSVFIQTALAFFLVHHALVKSSLFLGVGMPSSAKKIVLPGLALSALMLAGFPMTSGAFGKTFLKNCAVEAQVSSWTIFFMGITSFTTTLLMSRFLLQIKEKQPVSHEHSSALWQFISWGFLIISSLLFPYCFAFDGHPLKLAFSAKAIFSSLWPVLAGAFLAWFFLRFPKKLPKIPEGDLLYIWEAFAHVFFKIVKKIEYHPVKKWTLFSMVSSETLSKYSQIPLSLEARLQSFSIAIGFVVFLFLGLFFSFFFY